MGNSAEFTVLTYNIRHGRGLDGNQDLSRTEEVLCRAEAELIGLQEVDGGNSARSHNVEQSKVLAAALGMDYHFVPALTTPFPYGNAVLSKFPILKRDGFVMQKKCTFEDRSAAIVEVLIDDQPLTFITTHLGLFEGERLKHVDLILDYIASLDTPVVLVGDWNEEPGAAAYKRITEVLKDAATQFGKAEPTFPKLPLSEYKAAIRIDYIFVSPEIAVNEVATINNWASDHLPLQAKLELKTT